MRRNTNAFTLVELLVVITIIVILIAMLVPAMEKAIYQAELAKCAAQLKAVGTGLTSGAVQYQRKYPQRLSRYMPLDVNDLNRTPGDDRPYLQPYIGSINKLLNDPLSKAVDIEKTPTNLYAQTSYDLWYGWSTAADQKSMRRLGDRWGFQGQAFDLLAQDYELYISNGGVMYSSHPDRDSMLGQYISDNAGNQTTSTWAGTQRGLLDMNFLYADVSVLRIGGVDIDGKDDRMTKVPRGYNGAVVTEWTRVPRL